MSPIGVSNTLNDLTDYYSILDLKPDASPADIREAYFRAKATYQKDSVALYTLIDTGEREDTLRQIEEAYQVLSNPERRREYDRIYGQISSNNSPFELEPGEAETAKVISIDRAAPMENVIGNPLIAPRTDLEKPKPTSQVPSAFQKGDASSRIEPGHGSRGQSSSVSSASVSLPRVAEPAGGAQAELEKEIREQTEWSGAFIRKVRESRGISIEEVTHATKITKAYIVAIEEENFAKLPAAVFIRGFVSQLARLLRLPHQQVAASYMNRLQKANPEKFR